MTLLTEFADLSSAAQIAAWSGLALLMTAGGGLLLRPLRLARHDENDELGIVIAVVGVFYALIVAALLMRAISHFDVASEAVVQESRLAASLYRVAANYAPDLAESLRPPLQGYLQSVVDQEAPAQAGGSLVAVESAPLAAIAAALRDYRPATERQIAGLQQASEQLEALYAARHARLCHQDMSVPPEAWAISLAGQMLIILLAWLMHFARPALQFAMIATLAVSISIVLAVVLIYDTPYNGDISVPFSAYQHALTAISRDSLQY